MRYMMTVRVDGVEAEAVPVVARDAKIRPPHDGWDGHRSFPSKLMDVVDFDRLQPLLAPTLTLAASLVGAASACCALVALSSDIPNRAALEVSFSIDPAKSS